VRLARYLARAGASSRRGAAALVVQGRVAINGRPARGPGDPVDPRRDRVTVDGRSVSPVELTWLALHKPPGFVTSRRRTERHASVFSLLAGAPRSLVAVGRLDVYSEGLLLLTTDGELAARLMHPRWAVKRGYQVEVSGRLTPASRHALDRGVPLPGEAPARALAWRFRARSGGGRLELELGEGRTRLVRRVCAALGLGVKRLVRVSYGPVSLGSLPSGRSRPLAPGEVRSLYRAVLLPPPNRNTDNH
jgi:23S rRNA pseudouridine2605 synthase